MRDGAPQWHTSYARHLSPSGTLLILSAEQVALRTCWLVAVSLSLTAHLGSSVILSVAEDIVQGVM